MIQGQRLTTVNINCFRFSHIALVGCLIVFCRNPFFFFFFLYFRFLSFLGESCNDQRYFRTHEYIIISV